MSKILILDDGYQDAAAELAGDFPELQVTSEASADVAGLVAQFEIVDAARLDSLPNLKAALKLGRSYFNIDVGELRARGIDFATVPRKGPNCVAELALTLILALSKDLVSGHEAVAMGAYRYRGIVPELTSQRKIAFPLDAQHARARSERQDFGLDWHGRNQLRVGAPRQRAGHAQCLLQAQPAVARAGSGI